MDTVAAPAACAAPADLFDAEHRALLAARGFRSVAAKGYGDAMQT